MSTALVWRVSAAPSTKEATWQNATSLGGSATVYSYGSQAYTRAAPFLTLEQRTAFARGAELFNQLREQFAADALPSNQSIVLHEQFNAHSCAECHVRDGRSLTQAGDESQSPLVLRLGGGDGIETRFRLQSVHPGQAPIIKVDWRELSGSYADGTTYSLRAPMISIGGVSVSAASLRAAPPVYGLGLLEAVDGTTLQRMASQHTHANLGITGQLRWIDDEHGGRSIGRFGWKADLSGLLPQVRTALDEELGVQISATGVAHVAEAQVHLDLFNYMQLLGVGARTQTQGVELRRGAVQFERMHCAACHIPALRTGSTHPVASLRRQLIHPYSDLLLHNMGPGLMSDTSSIGRLWRTPPLWGIGLQSQVASQAGYLHDGRARNLSEAILWHGGEGEASRLAFVNADDAERRALISFIASL
jgi:CxxC motif-containing protein (DUF1111 family)